jgi:hypothetical protein
MLGRPSLKNKPELVGHQWLMPIVLTTWAAELRMIVAQDQPGQKKVCDFIIILLFICA